MDKHACKLCNRSFSSGRALGGHMRSHVVGAPANASFVKSFLVRDYSSSSISSREAEESKGLGYGLRENPKKSFRMVDPEFSTNFAAVASVGAGSSVVQDRESETESSAQASAAFVSIKRKRTKRRRRTRATLELLEAELLRSFSGITPEEDLAITFMLLSRDVWDKYEDEEEVEDEKEMNISSNPRQSPTNVRSRFQCETCKKLFRSYQALGGHRASHKKSRNCVPPADITCAEDVGSPEANAVGNNSVHVCPICFRQFSSGQALGGHKRSHLSSPTGTVTFPSPPRTAKLLENSFDLNLPAPFEEEAEQSAVSQAEFVNSGRVQTEDTNSVLLSRGADHWMLL